VTAVTAAASGIIGDFRTALDHSRNTTRKWASDDSENGQSPLIMGCSDDVRHLVDLIDNLYQPFHMDVLSTRHAHRSEQLRDPASYVLARFISAAERNGVVRSAMSGSATDSS
jgi:hypothetical protein